MSAESEDAADMMLSIIKSKMEEADMMFCASCGIAEVDDIKLKKCTACKLVRYCSVNCQKEHRSQHKRACKKRVAELRDDILFKQPDSSHLGDCLICFLPMPIDLDKCSMMSCCSIMICGGCQYATFLHNMEDRLEHNCQFCRNTSTEPSDVNTMKRDVNLERMKRIEANDPVAMREMGTECLEKGDEASAFKHWKKAADLGDIEAHYQLSVMYCLGGDGVDKDKKKRIFHLEEAAIGGHPAARFNLGNVEANDGRFERAIKHWIIAANLGYDNSMKKLRWGYEKGYLSKDGFAAALRAHQVAVDEMKSPQREAHEAVKRSVESNEAFRQQWMGC
jgi:hypothetical protein